MMRIIAGSHKNRLIIAPKGLETRPTASRLREALFNICQTRTKGCFFLDLFAGSGAMGLEALSRGAQYVTFVEENREVARCIQKNLENFKFQGDVIQGDVFRVLGGLKREFDIIYADPPYGKNHSIRLLRVIDQLPLLKPSGCLFIEESISVDLSTEALETLQLVRSRPSGRTTLHEYHKKSVS